MTDATVPILGGGTTSAPQDYLVKGGQVLGLMAVRATFDGSAAAAFLPCVQIISSAGNVMAQTVGSSVAAGASADVTFAPFLEPAGGGAVTNAVLYDTTPQTADFLESTTANNTTIENSGAGQINISSDDGSFGGGFIGITTADGEVFIGSTSIVNRLAAGGAFEIQKATTADVFQVFNTGDVQIRAAVLDVAATTSFIFALPTVAPAGANRLWNNAGVVNIT